MLSPGCFRPRLRGTNLKLVMTPDQLVDNTCFRPRLRGTNLKPKEEIMKLYIVILVSVPDYGELILNHTKGITMKKILIVISFRPRLRGTNLKL